jgi:predicted esterase
MSAGASQGRYSRRKEQAVSKLRGMKVLGVCTFIMMSMPGCGDSYRGIDPNKLLVFRIPVLRSEGTRDSTHCLVSVPADYTPDRSWPALIALHGYGSGAERFHAFWHDAAVTSGFVLITPQGEDRAAEGVGWSWGLHAGETVRRSIDVATRSVNIDESSLFLTGFSQGGRLVYTLALRHPHVFRGIAPIGAGRELPPTGRLDLLSGMRIYIGHGSLEPRLEEVRNLAAELRSRNCTVMLSEYPDVGHGFPDPPIRELRRLLAFLNATGND